MKLAKLFLCGLVACAGFTASTISATAQASTVALDCSGSDICMVYVDSTNPAPYSINWSPDTTGTNAIFPKYCNNKTTCTFRCPGVYSDPISGSIGGPSSMGPVDVITMTVTVLDANNVFIGSATAPAVCTDQPF